jgi:quercetin dioxygenase-like cupin family protein
MRKLTLSLGAFVLSASAAMAEGTVLNGDAVKWGDGPPFLPKGAQLAVVSGNPSGNGPYVVRAKLPPDYRIAAHHHPTAEYVTVLSGNFHLGMGDKLEPGKGQELRAGGFAEAPPGMNHYAWTSSETVIQIHGQGPLAIVYVNPADDPRKTQ